MSCSCGTTERKKVKILDIIQHDDTIYSFDLEDNLENWQEGDASKLYLQLADKEEARKFSFATLKDERIIRFTTRIKDLPSHYKTRLLQHTVGDELEISNPVGDLKLMREDRPIVFLSNGVGIAAVRPFIKAYEKDSTSIPKVLQINVDRSHKLYSEEMSTLENNLPFKSIYADSRTAFYKQLDSELQALLGDHTDPYIYVIGSDHFVLDVRSHLKTVGFSDKDILIEKHVLSSESCGCGPDNGCGCGANIIKTIGGFN